MTIILFIIYSSLKNFFCLLLFYPKKALRAGGNIEKDLKMKGEHKNSRQAM